MCRPHHNIDEFATALRAVGEPIRGPAGQGHLDRPDARRPVQDHPRLRHADPAASAAAAEDDGDGGRRRHQRSIPTSTCGRRPSPSSRNGCAASSAPRRALADEIVRDCPDAAQAARADPPHRPLLPAARRRPAGAAAARDRDGAAAPLRAMLLPLVRPRPARQLLLVDSSVVAWRMAVRFRNLERRKGQDPTVGRLRTACAGGWRGWQRRMEASSLELGPAERF